MSETGDLIISVGPYRLGDVVQLHGPEQFNELRDELIELRRKAEAYDHLFGTGAPVPAPHVYVQWKVTHLFGSFRCTCGALGSVDDQFAYTVECGACGNVWELPVNLPVIASAETEPHVLVHVDEGRRP